MGIRGIASLILVISGIIQRKSRVKICHSSSSPHRFELRPNYVIFSIYLSCLETPDAPPMVPTAYRLKPLKMGYFWEVIASHRAG